MPNEYSSIDITDPIIGRLLRLGFVLPHDPKCGLVVLLRGKPGTGKSTLALQLLDLMKAKKAAKYYCTLEQSEADVKFKLAAMLVARALDRARRPEYVGEPRFCFSFELLAADLKKHTSVPIPEPEQHLVKKATLPLYGEPKGDSLRSVNDAKKALANLLAKDAKLDRIRIRPTEYDRGSALKEGPFASFQSRVALAARILDDAVEDAKKKGSGKQKRTAEERARLPVVVVDGLSLLSTPEREAFELQRLVEKMRQHFQIGILVYEPNDNESTSIDHLADMVIELERRTIERPLAYLIHELCIRKARYQEAALGQHQFKIRESGLAVFPSLHFQVHHHNYMDLELERSRDAGWKASEKPDSAQGACTTGSLIDMIFAPKPGESVMLLGPRNSFKRQLCLDFLARGHWGCPKTAQSKVKEPGLLVSLIDNAPDIQHGLSCPWKKSFHGKCPHGRCRALLDDARPFCQRPGCITPAEFFHYIKERIIPSAESGDEQEAIVKRITFWDLTQMDYRFPLFEEDKMLLPALMDLFKTKHLKSLFMGAGNAGNTKAASAMADHVLFCWRSSYISKDAQKGAVASLMLYIDRASDSSQQSGKALYHIPVHRRDTLAIPFDVDRLNGHHKLNLPTDLSKLKPEDRRQIARITAMQGVA